MKRRLLAQLLVREATIRWGLSLEAENGNLAISPADKCPNELLELLRQHKAEVVSLLEAHSTGLKLDEAPWLHIARQILAGEFDNADSSTRESLGIGLSSIDDPVCRKALDRLRIKPQEPA